MDACEPKMESNGRQYQESIIGALLNLSVLPRTGTSIHEFFDNPLDQVIIILIISNTNILNVRECL